MAYTKLQAPAPVLFVSHGAPNVALEQGGYQNALRAFGETYRPQAVLVLSAHWRSGRGFLVDSATHPETLYDFSGFDPALQEVKYPVSTQMEMAVEACRLLTEAGLRTASIQGPGCDHGVWIPLRLIYPHADVPIIHVALDARAKPADIFAAGVALRPLRDEGVMIMGSGGLVHNLGLLDYHEPTGGEPQPWAAEFESWAIAAMASRDRGVLTDFLSAAPHARKAHPSWDHFAPLLMAMGATTPRDNFGSIFEGWSYGSLSMRSLVWQDASSPIASIAE